MTSEHDIVYQALDMIFASHKRNILADLTSAATQREYTTKQGRRERATAYVIENLTGYLTVFPNEEWVLKLLKAVDLLRGNARSPEAGVALDRAEKRLRRALEDPSCFYGNRQCVGCNEWYNGDDHECTSAAAKAKDTRYKNG